MPIRHSGPTPTDARDRIIRPQMPRPGAMAVAEIAADAEAPTRAQQARMDRRREKARRKVAHAQALRVQRLTVAQSHRETLARTAGARTEMQQRVFARYVMALEKRGVLPTYTAINMSVEVREIFDEMPAHVRSYLCRAFGAIWYREKFPNLRQHFGTHTFPNEKNLRNYDPEQGKYREVFRINQLKGKAGRNMYPTWTPTVADLHREIDSYCAHRYTVTHSREEKNTAPISIVRARESKPNVAVSVYDDLEKFRNAHLNGDFLTVRDLRAKYRGSKAAPLFCRQAAFFGNAAFLRAKIRKVYNEKIVPADTTIRDVRERLARVRHSLANNGTRAQVFSNAQISAQKRKLHALTILSRTAEERVEVVYAEHMPHLHVLGSIFRRYQAEDHAEALVRHREAEERAEAQREAARVYHAARQAKRAEKALKRPANAYVEDTAADHEGGMRVLGSIFSSLRPTGA